MSTSKDALLDAIPILQLQFRSAKDNAILMSALRQVEFLKRRKQAELDEISSALQYRFVP